MEIFVRKHDNFLPLSLLKYNGIISGRQVEPLSQLGRYHYCVSRINIIYIFSLFGYVALISRPLF